MDKKEQESREDFYKRIDSYPDKLDLALTEKRHEFGDIYSFIFEPERAVSFTPGMYAHVALRDFPEEFGKPVREFSIASAPSESYVQFTMHIRNESPYKQRMNDLALGDMISMYKIKGNFVLPEDTHKDVVLIAGGIGITPFHSMMREESKAVSPRKLTLVHVGRDDFLFEDILSKMPFKQHRTMRDNIPSTLDNLTKMKSDSAYYVAGPPGFVDALKEELSKRGIADGNIYLDWFDNYDDHQ